MANKSSFEDEESYVYHTVQDFAELCEIYGMHIILPALVKTLRTWQAIPETAKHCSEAIAAINMLAQPLVYQYNSQVNKMLDGDNDGITIH